MYCDFLLERHSNLGPILRRFREIAYPYSTLILGVFPLDQIADVGANLSG